MGRVGLVLCLSFSVCYGCPLWSLVCEHMVLGMQDWRSSCWRGVVRVPGTLSGLRQRWGHSLDRLWLVQKQ